MEKITEYTFAIGTINELKKGISKKTDKNIDSLKLFFDLENKKNIVTPVFGGVYQYDTFLIKNREDYENAKEEEFDTILTSSGLSIVRELMNINDDIEPTLIHIVYDKRIIQEKSFVKNILNDTTGRVAISDIYMLPDFSMKNTASIKRCRELLTNAYIKSKEFNDANIFETEQKEKTRALAEILKNQMQVYGLTRDEYTYLAFIKEINSFKTEKNKSKICKVPCFFAELIKHIKNANNI
ncbi:MAG: hypothetical protein QW041_02400 [Candidatus Pacearchaeota archaeon]